MELQKKKILYYFPEKAAYAKRHRWSTVRLPVMEVNIDDEWQMVCALVPEYYVKNRPWDKDTLIEAMNAVLKEREYHSYYLHPELAGKTGIEEKLPPEILFQKTLAGVPCWEHLFYIGSGRQAGGADENDMQRTGMADDIDMLGSLLSKYLPRINHFTLITDNMEAYEDFTESIYRDYGIPTANMAQMEKRCGRDGRTVVLDGRRDYRIPYSMIPSGAVYMDFWSVEQKKSTLEKMRRDVTYMSVVKFLDTIVKNGYNTIVNQTHFSG